MTTLARKNFSFDVSLQEAYKSPDGKMHVVGIASDDEEDRTGDRMSTKAVRSMAEQANTNRLQLLDNHKSTFGFGETFSAQAKRIKGKNGKVKTELMIDFELKDRYPQAHDLFEEVQSGKGQKQLSIGGFLNLKNPKAVKFEENAEGKVVRVLDDILLEHVATTRPGHAAVPRTRFVSAIVKDIFGNDDDLPADWRTSAGQRIADAVEAGEDSGSVEVDGEKINYEVSEKREGDATKRDIIVVMVDRNQNLNSSATKDEMKNKPGENIVTTQTTNETTTSAASAEDNQQEKVMSGTAPKEATAPAEAAITKTAETPTVDPSVQQGLDVISRIGKAFAAPKEELPAEVTDLAQAWEKMPALSELSEKSLDAVRRVHAGMLKLLATDGIDENGNEDVPSVFALKSEDIEAIAAAVAKTLKPAPVEGEETPKTNNDIIESFGTNFNGLTQVLGKGLTEMAGTSRDENSHGLPALVYPPRSPTSYEISRRTKRLQWVYHRIL